MLRYILLTLLSINLLPFLFFQSYASQEILIQETDIESQGVCIVSKNSLELFIFLKTKGKDVFIQDWYIGGESYNELDENNKVIQKSILYDPIIFSQKIKLTSKFTMVCSTRIFNIDENTFREGLSVGYVYATSAISVEKWLYIYKKASYLKNLLDKADL